MFRASLCLMMGIKILLVTNKSLFVASSWSHLYLLIKDARSFEHTQNSMKEMHADKEILSLLMLSSFITVMNTQNYLHVICLNT